MVWRLVKTKDCNQACCRERPLVPNEDGSNCIYNDGIGDRGCALMRGDALVPDEESKIFEGQTTDKVYQDTCVNWPQNTPEKARHATKTGGCCWQWVDDWVLAVG